MRFLLLSLIVTSVACSKMDSPKKSEGLGDQREFVEADLSADDVALIESICQAIDDKTADIESNYNEFTFDWNQKSCTESSVGAVMTVVTRLSHNRSSGVLESTFSPTTSVVIPFKQVETSESGVMGAICKQGRLNGWKAPIYQDPSKRTGIWYTMANNSVCRSSSGHKCIYIQKGSQVSSSNFYNIRTSDWMKFDVGTGAKRGFFTFRTSVSSVGCDKGNTEYVAHLK